MREERVNAIQGTRIITDSGPKTPMGNKVFRVGEYVWTDNGYVFGHEPEYVRSPMVSSLPGEVILEAFEGSDNMLNYRLVSVGPKSQIGVGKFISQNGQDPDCAIAYSEKYLAFFNFYANETQNISIKIIQKKTVINDIVIPYVYSSATSYIKRFDAYYVGEDLFWRYAVVDYSSQTVPKLVMAYYKNLELIKVVDLSENINQHINSMKQVVAEKMERFHQLNVTDITGGDEYPPFGQSGFYLLGLHTGDAGYRNGSVTTATDDLLVIEGFNSYNYGISPPLRVEIRERKPPSFGFDNPNDYTETRQQSIWVEITDLNLSEESAVLKIDFSTFTVGTLKGAEMKYYTFSWSPSGASWVISGEKENFLIGGECFITFYGRYNSVLKVQGADNEELRGYTEASSNSNLHTVNAADCYDLYWDKIYTESGKIKISVPLDFKFYYRQIYDEGNIYLQNGEWMIFIQISYPVNEAFALREESGINANVFAIERQEKINDKYDITGVYNFGDYFFNKITLIDKTSNNTYELIGLPQCPIDTKFLIEDIDDNNIMIYIPSTLYAYSKSTAELTVLENGINLLNMQLSKIPVANARLLIY